MGVIWTKVWFDLWHNRMRTLLAVLSIAAGLFAVGAMFGMGDLLTTNLDKSHKEVVPPHLELGLGQMVDRDILLDLVNVPGVEGVDPYCNVSISYKVNPNGDWKQGIIQLRDYTEQKYELVQLRDGNWPKKGELGVERMAAGFLNLGAGDKLIVKDGAYERSYPLTSKIRHPFVPPPQFMDLAFFFANGETLERFGVPDGKFNAAFIRVQPYSADYAKEVASAIKDRLAKQNISVLGVSYQDPNKHWGRSFFDGITLVLQLLASISVVISAVLVYNTLSNLITQQTNQIGILKAIGGKSGTIIQVYLSEALFYGLLALVISIPLGAVVTFAMTQSFLGLFNIDYNDFELSTFAITAQIISAILVTLLAGLIPTMQGAMITVRQAIASYGLGSDFGSNWLDRLIEKIGARLLPAHYATALGNMFRRKGRLLLTQIVLITAGFAFLLVMSLNSSISLTLDHLFARNHYDSTIQFTGLERTDPIFALANTVNGVDKAELRLIQSASLLVKGQLIKDAGIGASIEGIPSDSDFFSPLIIKGRWIQPGDGRVIVIKRDTAEKNHIEIGDIVTLNLGDLGKDTWQVIGTYEPVFTGNFSGDRIYAPLESLYAATKKHNQGSMLYVRTKDHSAEAVTAVTKQLKELFDGRKHNVAITATEPDTRKTNEFQFSTITTMLVALSVIVAIVGGIALMGALSISVVERTKEIGVLRAVGARSRTIIGIFLMEGVLQGLLSCVVAIPLSFALGGPLASALGQAMFGAKLDYAYNWSAVGTWIIIMLVISMVASILPARSATRISVRESLAYA
ncbi:MAG: FtsX-like permease family protein [Chloroflexi bacterium]|nr:FtsX-like permease family protein [Chloroflexota bacterium]